MAFGHHLIGTYALDESCTPYPIITYSGSRDDKMHGYPAAFMPIRSPLPIATGIDIFYFFCLAYHPKNYGNNLHVYAKSMIYAYKNLITNTNILECGQVQFFVDRRCMDIVSPYCRAANLQGLVQPYDSDISMNYAAYVPCFFHETARSFKYRIYTDLDVWWANMSDKPVFDFRKLIAEWDRQEASIFGQRVPKSERQSSVDLYERYLTDDKQLSELRNIMVNKFGSEAIGNELGISGTRNAIRAGAEANKLKECYEQYGDLLRDDEAFWAFFLTDTGYPVADIGIYMRGGGPRKEEMELWDRGPMMVNVGSYHFDHFHQERYEGFQKLYEHFKG